jgi:hypothetical protein
MKTYGAVDEWIHVFLTLALVGLVIESKDSSPETTVGHDPVPIQLPSILTTCFPMIHLTVLSNVLGLQLVVFQEVPTIILYTFVFSSILVTCIPTAPEVNLWKFNV